MVAYDISAMMEYKGITLEEAAKEVIHKKLKELEGKGGVVAVGKGGKVVMEFNTPGMYRGYVKEDGEKTVKMYKD